MSTQVPIGQERICDDCGKTIVYPGRVHRVGVHHQTMFVGGHVTTGAVGMPRDICIDCFSEPREAPSVAAFPWKRRA